MRLKLGSIKRLLVAAVALVLAVALFVISSNYYIILSTRARVYTEAASLPFNDVGLVLGSSRTSLRGMVNPHFKARIEAAADLFKKGKVKHLLLSGDNHIKNYDEPADMRAALAALGVPDQDMTLDYAGFRTLDSLARAREVFGLSRLTIVTDDFHVYRSLFLARHFGVDAVAYSAHAVPDGADPGPAIREIAARVKAVLDVIVNRQPRFTGPRVDIRV